jgi:hypothetical protein
MPGCFRRLKQGYVNVAVRSKLKCVSLSSQPVTTGTTLLGSTFAGAMRERRSNKRMIKLDDYDCDADPPQARASGKRSTTAAGANNAPQLSNK